VLYERALGSQRKVRAMVLTTTGDGSAFLSNLCPTELNFDSLPLGSAELQQAATYYLSGFPVSIELNCF